MKVTGASCVRREARILEMMSVVESPKDNDCVISTLLSVIIGTAGGDAAEVNFKGFSNFSFTSSWVLFADVLVVSLISSLASLVVIVDNVCADDVSTDAGVSTALSFSLALSTAEISCTCCGLTCSSSDTTELAMFCDITTGIASSLFDSIFEGAVVCVATASKTLSSASVDLMTLLATVVNCCGTGSTLIGAVVGAVCVTTSGGCTSILVTSIGVSCSFDESLTSVSMSLIVSSFILPEFLAHCVLHLAAILAQVVCNEMPHCLQELKGSGMPFKFFCALPEQCLQTSLPCKIIKIISSFYNLLQLFSHNVFMEFMVRTNCLTNTLYTGPLLLRTTTQEKFSPSKIRKYFEPHFQSNQIDYAPVLLMKH
uniref:Uncharacterized protein n=1 Tax=Glossina palpalis gambiensis TaxID=67801 RepID=A0A1B0B9Z4_9MUSC